MTSRDFSSPERASAALDALRRKPPGRPVRIMNVCGSHERAVSELGLRRSLPSQVKLIPGPGCPVCVCPEEDLAAAIALALTPSVRLAVFGDLLRVPLSNAGGGPRSLAECRDAGGRLSVVSSPSEAREIAKRNPAERVVFFSAGFETTTAPLAACIIEGLPDNMSLLLSHKRTSPAVRLLLEGGEVGFDALIAPGHVSAMTGSEEWRFVPLEFGVPTAVCGFYDLSLVGGIAILCQLVEAGRAELENLYGQVVRPGGNQRAKAAIGEVFEVCDAVWRGVGTIKESGYRLAPGYAHLDARRRFDIVPAPSAGAMPAGCSCHHVVMGRMDPAVCPLFGAACTPQSPVGPCMVSAEGACNIWFKHRGGY